MNTKVKNRGITLIALVITIIVLIILATISIKAVLGENGIIKKAQLAKEMHTNAIKKEEEEMNHLLEKFTNMIETDTNENNSTEPEIPIEPELPDITETTQAGTIVKKPEKWTTLKGDAISDGKGTIIPLPTGFYYIGGDINTGLVISDKEGDTLDSSGINSGNQFVWIPVKSESDFTRTDFNSTTGQITDLNENYTEPYIYGYLDAKGVEEKEEYEAMKTQVLKYGGFYIGRYEAGINSTTLRTGATTAQVVVCKKGVAPYNYIPWGKDTINPSEIEGKSGAVYVAKSMYKTSDSVTSTLCYGCEWDAMCRYIEDRNRSREAKYSIELTGNLSSDVSKNIYDLAGNCFEWTMEAYSNNDRVVRGSEYNFTYPISFRQNFTTTMEAGWSGFRCALYIN